MTNPSNAVGTNAAYGGRTSVNAFNDWASFYSRGIVSGWVAAPASGMTIQLGGLAGIRDVALAEDPNGNKTTVNNTTTSPIPVEIAAASTTATRHDLIVAYVNSPAQVSSTTLDNPSACGIISVQGSQSSLPNDAAIRAAITSDGGTGTTAYYVALAEVSVPANTTTITSELILQTDFNAQVNPAGILPPESITSDKIDWTTISTVNEAGDIVMKIGNIQIVTMRREFNVNVNSPWGSGYECAVGQFEYPEPFAELPSVTIGVVSYDSACVVEYLGISGGTRPIASTTQTGGISLFRPSPATVSGYVCINAIGVASS